MQVYHNLSDRCGVPQLAKKLNSVSSCSFACGGVVRFDVTFMLVTREMTVLGTFVKLTERYFVYTDIGSTH
jgi:hypothetical protein